MRNDDSRFTRSVFANSCGVTSATGIGWKTPALLIRMAGAPPKVRVITPAARATASASETSQGMGRAAGPISFARAASASPPRASMATRAPLSASARVMAARCRWMRRSRRPSARWASRSQRRLIAAVRQRQKLLARARVVPENARDGRRHRLRILLLNTAHHHAEMICFDHDAHAARLEHALNRFGDLLGEPLLHLQAARKHLDDARELGEPYDLVVRDVRDVRLAEEGKHVMLAQRIELDVAHHDHARVLFLEHGIANDVLHALVVAAREPGERCRHALGCPEQALALGVLADQFENGAHVRLELRCGGRRLLSVEHALESSGRWHAWRVQMIM